MLSRAKKVNKTKERKSYCSINYTLTTNHSLVSDLLENKKKIYDKTDVSHPTEIH